MKSAIHPPYFKEARIRCSCGNIMIIGSTKEDMKVELCAKCHPFYTGQQKLVDTAGRVDRFEAKRKAAERIKEEKKEQAAAKLAKKTYTPEPKKPAKKAKRAIGKK